MAVLALASVAAAGSFRQVAGRSTWTLVRQEARYAAVAEWFVQRTTERSLVFADLHSGSLRLYANRPTLRWVRMPEGNIVPTVLEAQRRGIACYAVFDDESEAASFERRAEGSRGLRLDPAARVRSVMIHRVSVAPDAGAGVPNPSEPRS